MWLIGGSTPPPLTNFKTTNTMITRTLSMKSHWYKTYKTITKQFNDEQHLNNYINFMESKGYKTIGVYGN